MAVPTSQRRSSISWRETTTSCRLALGAQCTEDGSQAQDDGVAGATDAPRGKAVSCRGGGLTPQHQCECGSSGTGSCAIKRSGSRAAWISWPSGRWRWTKSYARHAVLGLGGPGVCIAPAPTTIATDADGFGAFAPSDARTQQASFVGVYTELTAEKWRRASG